jgi:hypothetical protein
LFQVLLPMHIESIEMYLMLVVILYQSSPKLPKQKIEILYNLKLKLVKITISDWQSLKV